MTLRDNKKYITGIVAGIAALSIFSIMFLSSTTNVSAVDQKTIADTLGIVQPGPSPIEVPIISENWVFHPRDNVPSTGKAQLMISEIFVKPDQYNKINYGQAKFLQNNMDKLGKYVDLPDQSKADYFAYRNLVKNNMAYFEMTFPNGTTKYYHMDFHEDPLQ